MRARIPKIVDRGSIVYRYMGKEDAWYPATTSIKKSWETRRNISEVIAEILDIRYGNNLDLKIGLVLPKNVTWQQFIPFGYDNVEVLTFGDLRGKNSLEECNVLFVIGTYCTYNEEEVMKQKFSDWYACDPLTTEFIEKKPHGDYYHYIEKELEILRWMQEDYEMYQAIHRIRPLLKKKEVYVFGVVPKEISKDGLRVVKIKGSVFVRNFEAEWLENYVKERIIVYEGLARFDMAEQLGFKKDTAYRKIKQIVEKSEVLRFTKERGQNDIEYVYK